MHPRMVRKRREERFSYPLRPGLASVGTREQATKRSDRASSVIPVRVPALNQNLLQIQRDSGFNAAPCPQMCNGTSGNDSAADLRPRPLVADGLQFHRAVGNRDPEGGADGAFDQMDVAVMGADQFGGNG